MHLPESMLVDLNDAVESHGIVHRPTARLTIEILARTCAGVGGHKLDGSFLPLHDRQTKNLPTTFDAINGTLGQPFEILRASPEHRSCRGVRLIRPLDLPRYDTLQGSQQVDIDGKKRRAGRAGHSRDVAGNNSVWTPEITSKVPVNRDDLRAAIDSGRLTIAELGASKFIFESSPLGTLPQSYTEAVSGRQYADGISLQNVPKSIRRLALNGYEVDMVNAHLALTVYLAKESGYRPSILENLARHPKEFRESLAEFMDIPVETAKELYLAALYGATMDGDLRRILDRHGADPARLKAMPEFAKVMSEARCARKSIIDAAKKAPRGIVNLAGKSVSANARALQVYAHLLQGLESVVLRAATNGERSVLSLEHDGWTQSDAPDLERIKAKVQKGTGIDVDFAVKSQPKNANS